MCLDALSLSFFVASRYHFPYIHVASADMTAPQPRQARDGAAVGCKMGRAGFDFIEKRIFMPKQPHLAIHALHTTTGGGLVYLNNILPHLAVDASLKDWQKTLFIRPEMLAKIKAPEGINVVTYALPQSFWRAHLVAQLKFPHFLKKRGVTHTLCNANFTPLMAPNPIPIIHTTPIVIQFAEKLAEKVYWKALKWLTVVSLWRAPLAFTVAMHVIPRYTPFFMKGAAQKVHRANPAMNEGAVPTPLPQKIPSKIVAVGDFYIQKDYPTLIEAFALIKKEKPEATLTIIGRPLITDVVQQAKAVIDQHNLQDAVTITGSLPHHALMAEMASAEVLLNTSVAECFNMPLLESMSVETLVVAADTDFQKEVVGTDGKAATLVEHSAYHYANAVLDLLNSPKKAKAQRLAAKKHAAQFSWAETAQTIAREISKLV